MENKKESHSSSFLRTNKDLSVGKIRVQTGNVTDGESPMKEYVLIKLRSGEEIIASMKSKNRSGVKILRPMQIKQIPFVDHLSGSLKAAVVMENWIGRTNENEVTIPNNWIGVKMPPSQEVIDAYEKHILEEDMTVSATQPTAPIKVPLVEEDKLKELEKEMTSALMDIIMPQGATSQADDMANFIANMNPQNKSDNKEVVVVNMMFPSNVFKNMMEEGLLDDLLASGMDARDDMMDPDDDDLEEDVDDRPKKPRDDKGSVSDTGDWKKWGNSWQDWSPDPKDYL